MKFVDRMQALNFAEEKVKNLGVWLKLGPFFLAGFLMTYNWSIMTMKVFVLIAVGATALRLLGQVLLNRYADHLMVAYHRDFPKVSVEQVNEATLQVLKKQFESQIGWEKSCPICKADYVNVGHPMRPGVVVQRHCRCVFESVQQGTTTIISQKPPS